MNELKELSELLNTPDNQLIGMGFASRSKLRDKAAAELADLRTRLAAAEALVTKWREAAKEIDLPPYDYEAAATERTLTDCADELATALGAKEKAG